MHHPTLEDSIRMEDRATGMPPASSASNRIGSVLALTDFSAPAGLAVTRAALLAAQHRARLRLFHVVERSPLGQWAGRAGWPLALGRAERKAMQAGDVLADMARRMARRHGIEVDWQVLEGRVLPHVLDAARDVDLVVLGARARGVWRAFAPGLAARLALRCPAPLLLAREPARKPYRRVLVAVDLSPGSEHALRAALRLAPRSEVRLLHALRHDCEEEMLITEAPIEVIRDVRAMMQARARARMLEIGAGLTAQAAGIEIALEFADTVEMVLRHRERMNSDLVVMKAHAPRVTGLGFRGLTRRMLARGGGDVLVLPTPRPGTALQRRPGGAMGSMRGQSATA